MFKSAKFLFLSAALGLGLAASSAHAQYDESRIRQADQQTQVVGYRGCAMFFTISGYASDYIVTPFYCGPLGSAPYVIERVNHSGGQTSYRFCVTAQAGWNQMIIDLWRNGCLIDGDRVRIF